MSGNHKLSPAIEVRSNSVSPQMILTENDNCEDTTTTTEPTTPINNQYLSHSWHHLNENHTSKLGPSLSSPQTLPIKVKSASLVPLHSSIPTHPNIGSRSQPTSRRGSTDSDSNFQRFTRAYLIPAAKWAYSPLNKNKRKIKQQEEQDYIIEYSTFRPLRNLPQLKSGRDLFIHWRRIVEEETKRPFDFPDNYLSERDFAILLNHIIEVIEVNHEFPQRIAQGSSGSYFVYGKTSNSLGFTKVGIFKPKDEEPYGPLSPKWSKWAHRTFFPCCFGRSCLIPNLGYISEAAACYLDRQLQSYIVPYTEVICLRSPTFFYSYWDKDNNVKKLPQKIGSFQVFLQGYTEAEAWIRQNPIPSDHETISQLSKYSNIEVDINDSEYIFTWSIESMRQFQEEVEKLVILDYMMRNTDRGLDNWMIKVDWIEVEIKQQTKIVKPKIKIGAIDSGLAFPWKHPDEWRSFPFGWLFLPYSIIGQPFSMRTRNHYLPLLTSKIWWEQTVKGLRQVLAKDQDFKERLWHKQLAVLKGQAFNIVEILKLGYAGPLELTKRENLLVFDDVMYMPENIDSSEDIFRMQTSMYESDTSRQYQDDIYTPLLPGSNYLSSSLAAINEDDVTNESGYEHINRDHSGVNSTGTRRVIIERLVKETSRPPVFTWW